MQDFTSSPISHLARQLVLGGSCARGRQEGVVLGVFHNRRLDADLLTLKAVIQSGRLGRIWRVHSRMDFDDPQTLEAAPTGVLLRDLGSHLVDQMLWLLGPAVSVTANWDMAALPQGATDAALF
ncbi:Gfo/Idh/MocA family protein [Rhizobium rhizogenes]|uniref:Gfo/Idh/MocA family protein n=1 Tax=Rhizobium rhizogenes TaxID=359 RepID=UPI00191D28ED